VACAWPVRCVLAFLTATDGSVTDKVVLANGTAAPEPRLWDFSQPIGTRLQHETARGMLKEIAATRIGAMGQKRAFDAPQLRFRLSPNTGHHPALGRCLRWAKTDRTGRIGLCIALASRSPHFRRLAGKGLIGRSPYDNTVLMVHLS
jgi:hypothetical protein